MTEAIKPKLKSPEQSLDGTAQVIHKLQQSFCAGLGDRIFRIETAWGSVNAHHVSAIETLSVIEFETHRIAGLAGSLNLSEMGLQAKELETYIRTIKPPLSTFEKSKLEKLLDEFLDLLAQHQIDD